MSEGSVDHRPTASTYVAGVAVHAFLPSVLPDCTAPSLPPYIYVMHGRGSSSSAVYSLCHSLSTSGFIAVTFDTRNHGANSVDAERNKGVKTNPHAFEDIWAHLLCNVDDMRRMFEFLHIHIPPCTCACAGRQIEQRSICSNIRSKVRIGVTGISLGGHSTLLGMANEMGIGVGVSIIGSGDILKLLSDRKLPPGNEEMRHVYVSKELESSIQRYGAMANVDSFRNRPLLIINGGADTLVPAEMNTDFLERLKDRYTEGDRIKWSVYEGVGHECTPEMVAETIAWFRRWFGVDSGASSEVNSVSAGLPAHL